MRKRFGTAVGFGLAIVMLLMVGASGQSPSVQGVTIPEGLWFGPDQTVDVVVTWPVPFVDAAYHVACTFISLSLSSPTGGGAAVQHTRARTPSEVTVSMHNGHYAWDYGGVSCVGVR